MYILKSLRRVAENLLREGRINDDSKKIIPMLCIGCLTLCGISCRGQEAGKDNRLEKTRF